MGEEEPQSFRDLGLALEAAGQYQAAVASLYEVVVRPWDGRFDGISLIALDEPTKSPAPIIPPKVIIETCRDLSERLSCSAARSSRWG